MNFDWSEEQALLRASVERWGADRYGGDLEKRRRYRKAEGGFDRAGWAALADLGLTALPFAESDGGLGGGPVEVIAVAEPLGRALAVEPFTECLVPAAAVLRGHALAPRVAAGEVLPTFATFETAGRYNPQHVETRARATDGGWTLNGAKCAVWQGMAADVLLVSARTGGATRDADGIALFAVPADAPGVTRRAWAAADGQLLCELTLGDVRVGADACLGELSAIERAREAAWLAASAEMLGIAGLLLDATLAYVKQRTQFGRPLGAFQVIQHRLVDCYVAIEQSRSQALRAALTGAQGATSAKAYVSEAALKVAHEAVQLHGGMGVTDELVIGHGLKRIQMLSRLFGDAGAAVRAQAAELARAA